MPVRNDCVTEYDIIAQSDLRTLLPNIGIVRLLFIVTIAADRNVAITLAKRRVKTKM